MTVLALNGAPYRLAQVRARWALAAITAVVIVAWLGAVFLFDSVRFVVFSPLATPGSRFFLRSVSCSPRSFWRYPRLRPPGHG